MAAAAPCNSSDYAAIQISEPSCRCSGQWTVQFIAPLERRLANLRWPAGELHLDGSDIAALDTVGALLLLDLVAERRRAGQTVRVHGLRQAHRDLVKLVHERRAAPLPTAGSQPAQLLGNLGRRVWHGLEQLPRFLAFLGETNIALLRNLLHPTRIRWRALCAVLQSAGLNAMPIIGLLCFLIGLVIAYQGGNQLRYYGANIFIVELVSIAMVRELAPLMTAIIVAGRTGSAFTAQIGTMKVTEEIDALRTIGIDPFDILVLPKMLGLIIALPLLTLFADAASIFGGMVVGLFLLDIEFADFIDRIPRVVSLISFVYGIGKTLIFAMVIAVVGCYQGFRVSGGADSVGRQTTQSVVQSIFLVILLNALFAVAIGSAGLYVR